MTLDDEIGTQLIAFRYTRINVRLNKFSHSSLYMRAYVRRLTN